MDPLQQQINTLHHKVDQLNNVVERLSGQLTSLNPLVEEPLQPLPPLTPRRETLNPSRSTMIVDEMEFNGHNGNGHTNGQATSYPSPSYPSYQRQYREDLDHKDIIPDNPTPQPIPQDIHEPKTAQDIQIRRLMAQLTAAYNRIATLEEQLLACRMKGNNHHSPNS